MTFSYVVYKRFATNLFRCHYTDFTWSLSNQLMSQQCIHLLCIDTARLFSFDFLKDLQSLGTLT